LKPFVLAMVAALTACRTDSTGGVDDPAAIAEVRATVRRIIAADNARDLEGAVGCYTEDAQWLPPGSQPIFGRAALRESYSTMFSSWEPSITVISDETWVLGDLAVDRGRTLGHLVSRKGGATRTLDDKYAMWLRRGSDGQWRIACLMWNANETPD
jgi:uncharacterized protein (TIGR02246 family)